MPLKADAPVRTVTEIGKGDFVKVGSEWKEVHTNTAHGFEKTPRDWLVTTMDGAMHNMFDINRYAKAEDLT